MKEEKEFEQRVRDVVSLIPVGRVSTYGAIGKWAGSGRSARMVGWILNRTPLDPFSFPAHRVVNRNGLLTGKRFFGGNQVMEQLLESEGIRIENDQVADFEKFLWDPNKELI